MSKVTRSKMMKLTIKQNGFVIDTKLGMTVEMDKELICFCNDSVRLNLPVDSVVELVDNLNLAYKLLIRNRRGDLAVGENDDN